MKMKPAGSGAEGLDKGLEGRVASYSGTIVLRVLRKLVERIALHLSDGKKPPSDELGGSEELGGVPPGLSRPQELRYANSGV